MAKFGITENEEEKNWNEVVLVANRKCYDAKKAKLSNEGARINWTAKKIAKLAAKPTKSSLNKTPQDACFISALKRCFYFGVLFLVFYFMFNNI